MGKKRSSSKGVDMPTPRWYAVYQGQVLEGERREIAEEGLERIKDSNKAVRGEQYGVGPWFAVKVGRDCVTKQSNSDYIGPYLTPHIALSVISILNIIAHAGAPQLMEKMTVVPHKQLKMEMEV
jgi:hypothetical protein